MLPTCSELHVCSYPSHLCRQLGNYETRSISLVTMNETCSILIFMYHSDILLSPSRQQYIAGEILKTLQQLFVQIQAATIPLPLPIQLQLQLRFRFQCQQSLVSQLPSDMMVPPVIVEVSLPSALSPSGFQPSSFPTDRSRVA